MTETTFRFRGEQHTYLDDPYNTTRLNERAVEVPIAAAFLDRQPIRSVGLEVGNVLSHYRPGSHRVVDRHEQAPGVENLDVFDIVGAYDWIVAVSTLEHVRWDETPREPDGAAQALSHLRSLLTPDGRLLLTHPFGWHPFFDAHLLELHAGGALGDARTLVRSGTGWIETLDVTPKPYAATTRWAESVLIAEMGA